jgi:hypothetical protein
MGRIRRLLKQDVKTAIKAVSNVQHKITNSPPKTEFKMKELKKDLAVGQKRSSETSNGKCSF